MQVRGRAVRRPLLPGRLLPGRLLPGAILLVLAAAALGPGVVPTPAARPGAAAVAAPGALAAAGPPPAPGPPDGATAARAVRGDAGRFELTPGSAGRVVAGGAGDHSVTWTAPARPFSGVLARRVPSGCGPGRADDPGAPGSGCVAAGTCRVGRPGTRAPRAGSSVVTVAVRCPPGGTARLEVADLQAPTRAGDLALLAAVQPDGAPRPTGVSGVAVVRVVPAGPEALRVAVPHHVRAGRPLDEPVLVEVLDRWGNRVTDSDHVVGLRAQSRTGRQPLGGERIATTDEGVAALHELVLPRASTGVALIARARPVERVAGRRLGGSSAAFRVLGPPRRLVPVDGRLQGGRAGHPLPLRVGVRVLDAAGNALPDVAVAFAAGEGGRARGLVPTGADGVARTSWRLGPVPGVQHLEALVAGRSTDLLAVATSDALAELLEHPGAHRVGAERSGRGAAAGTVRRETSG